jgi:hypothetical protein
LQAVVYYLRIAVDEEDTEGPASVRSRALQTDIPPIRLDFVLPQFC